MAAASRGCYPALVEGEATSDSSGKSRVRAWSGHLVKAGVSAAALWILASHVDLGRMLEVLRRADLVMVSAVVLLYLVGQLLTAYRWRVIATRVGFDHSMTEIARYYFIGMFFNLFGPSTLGGDVVRSLYLGQRDKRRTVAFNTVIFDRLSGLATLVAVAVIAMAVFGRFDLPLPLVWLTCLAGAGIIVGWWVIPPVVRMVLDEGSRLRRLVEVELDPFWRDRALLWRAAWVSISFHVLQVVALILLGASISMDLAWQYYFIFHPLVTILSALPISLAGLGIREMGYVWFLERQGIDNDVAVAFGLLWFVVLLVSSLFGGLVYLTSGSSLPPFFRPSCRRRCR